MMYDSFASYERLGYDLAACLEYNPQDGITDETIAAVLAVWEGENDGDDWRWIVSLTDGRFAFIQGGCDYTGWDCQSWASSEITDDADAAALCALPENTPPGTLLDPPQGLGHMVSILTGTYMKNAQEVYMSLALQLQEGKIETWREQKDKEFGL